MNRGDRVAALTLAAAFAALVGLGLWAFWLEPASLRTRTYSLSLPGWPTSCDGLRVAVLADLHTGSPFNGLDKLARIVARTNEMQPDLVLLAGDYVIHGVVGGNYIAPTLAAEQLGLLTAPMGRLAVRGNHDRLAEAVEIRTAFRAHAIELLEDAASLRRLGECELWVAGISDFWEGKHDIHGALREVPANAAVIALTHNPDIFPDMPARVALTVAGHTHGGQVYLPYLGRLKVPSLYGERFALGHVVEDGRHLFVSPGLGTSIVPVRFLVPPEISILELHAQ